ncbi:hypothetical protein SC206_02515 [Rouxiella sp. T17]|uniref:hypothetical protein n=1 Tax=Rouxiella sp. T17 TaxID=3085684 RepID=UPI002FCC57D5
MSLFIEPKIVKSKTRMQEKARDNASWLSKISAALGSLALISLLCALASCARKGLDNPLTHTANGVAAVLITLLIINEKYSPTPLLAKGLRVQPQTIAAEFIATFYAASSGCGLILLMMQHPFYGLTMLFLTAALAFWAGTKLSRGNETALGYVLQFGLISGVAGLGLQYHDAAASAYLTTVLMGLNHGVILSTLWQTLHKVTAPAWRKTARKVSVIMLVSGFTGSLGIVAIIFSRAPLGEGFTCAFGLLTVFSLCAWLAGSLVDSA